MNDPAPLDRHHTRASIQRLSRASVDPENIDGKLIRRLLEDRDDLMRRAYCELNIDVVDLAELTEIPWWQIYHNILDDGSLIKSENRQR